MNIDLKIIKKKYGEDMMHFCRDAFSTILESEGILSNLFLMHIEPTHELYFDLVNNELLNDFKKYKFSLYEKKDKVIETNKSPKKLLDEAGYILYECKCEEDIKQFEKYYSEGEKLCTFGGGRLDSCHVFFAIKKNVDKIKREDFKYPKRQDEYGTSVISIQFTKDDSHTLSIKNRYNHTVENPDATFSNNLDNIILGLTDSFAKHYNLIQRVNKYGFEIPSYVFANDGKLYKYYTEAFNKYYCINNVILDNYEVKRFPKEKYLIFEYFILDIQNKQIYLYDNVHFQDSFIDGIKDIKNIQITKNKDSKKICFTPNNGEEIVIILDKDNEIISYKNNNIKEIKVGFLGYNFKLKYLECNNVEKIGDYFLRFNKGLNEINLPNVKKIGKSFLESNISITKVSLPNVITIGSYFMDANKKLTYISLPNVEKIGDGFLIGNFKLEKIDLPKVKIIYHKFLSYNDGLKEFSAPLLEKIGEQFLCYNAGLEKFDCPRLELICNDFLIENTKLKTFNAPSLKEVGSYFLWSNTILENKYVLNFKGRKSIPKESIYDKEEITKRARRLSRITARNKTNGGI